MERTVGLFAATLFVATSTSAIPAQPSEVIKTFVKSEALQELLADQHSYKSIAISLAHKLSNAVEMLCNQHSRSRSIVSVTLERDFATNEFHFQTPFSPNDLKRCGSGGEL